MEKQNKPELTIIRIFDASKEKVWDAWTDPELLKKWWGPKEYSCPDCQIDLRVGGKFTNSMLGPDGKIIWGTGTYKEIIQNEKLVFTDSFADDKGNVVPSEYYGMNGMPLEMLVTVILEEVDGKTKMTMTHAGLSLDHQKGANFGWNSSFDKMVELLK